MEHRWGERVAVRLTVELSYGSSSPVVGSLENVSSSGAFVHTDGRGPPRGPVEVIFPDRSAGRGRTERIAAYVVRETETGVGIEWCEFAPRVVRELIARDRRAGGVRARARPLRASRDSTGAAEAAMQPCAPSAAEPVAMATAAR